MAIEPAQKVFSVAVFLFLLCLSIFSPAQEDLRLWRNAALLDGDTQSRLSRQESFFDGLFQLPAEYEKASRAEQLTMQKEWVRQLQGTDREAATAAAAYLGMVRSRPAVRFLEKTVSDPKSSGRFLWVATRSLAQLRSESSIPVFIGLLDNRQRDSQVYARVGLAEITGVYFGADKRKWQEWAGLPVDSSAADTTDAAVRTVGKALILKDQPDDPSDPKMNLSAAERLENFDILAEAIDQYYSFFEYKNIDWPKITAAYRRQVETSKTDTEFYRLLYQFVRELKDAHSWLCNYDHVPKLDSFMPPVYTRLIDEKLVVTDVLPNSDAYLNGLRPGVVITGIDGMEIPEKIEHIRPFIKMVSSEHHFREIACRRILCGPKGSDVTIRFFTNGQTKIVRLERTVAHREMIAVPDFPVTKQQYIWDGVHAGGFGYIRIVSFQGREAIADEFDRALERLKNTPGLIIDVRENPGGFGTAQPRIVGRLITERTTVNIAYVKDGPNHNDFSEHQTEFEPTGPWQYTKPVVVLTDAITGSASDLFVCRLKSTGRVTTMGTCTHGNSTGTCVYVQLPCNLLVRVSSGYICDADGTIIERNGNVPMIAAAPTIADIINGTDSVIDRAVEQLHQHTNAP